MGNTQTTTRRGFMRGAAVLAALPVLPVITAEPPRDLAAPVRG
jgi:hypothetical protein